MVEPLVEPSDKLSLDEIRAIPPDDRGKYIESSVLALINANEGRGLTLAEIQKVTRYPKNSLIKHIELLYARRKISRISRGRISIYFPVGKNIGDEYRDIIFGKGNDHRIGIRVIESIDGKYAIIQEKELDQNGFLRDIGGVMVPFSIIPEINNILLRIGNGIVKEIRAQKGGNNQ